MYIETKTLLDCGTKRRSKLLKILQVIVCMTRQCNTQTWLYYTRNKCNTQTWLYYTRNKCNTQTWLYYTRNKCNTQTWLYYTRNKCNTQTWLYNTRNKCNTQTWLYNTRNKCNTQTWLFGDGVTWGPPTEKRCKTMHFTAFQEPVRYTKPCYLAQRFPCKWLIGDIYA